MNEVNCKCVGMLDIKGQECIRRVYSPDGVSPTITTMGGGNREPKIIEPQALRMVRTEEGKKLRKQYESHELECGLNEHRRAEPREDGCSNTLSTVQKDNYVAIPQATNRGFIGGDCRSTLTTVQKENVVIEPSIRVRKLTPKECYRLMDFDDADYERASSVVSQTQLYKQAGNSIVVNCLTAIFGQMFDGKEDVYKHST